MIESINSEAKKIINEGWTDGIVISYGTSTHKETICNGEISGNPHSKVSSSTLYDIASVTKLFFLIIVMNLIESGVLSLDAQVGDYSKSFKNIERLRLYELLNFSVSLSTDKRIDSFTSHDEAIQAIKNIHVIDKPLKYSDMGAIVMSVLIDETLSDSLYDYSKKLWHKNNLNNTFWWNDYNNSLHSRIQSYDNEHILSPNGVIVKHLPLGTVHDPKSQILKVSGHAGIISTPEDISIFSQAILSNSIISRKSLNTITSHKYDLCIPPQRLGLLCYRKAFDQKNSEVSFRLSDSAFAISGYTGTYLVIDPESDIFITICSNRIYNRCASTHNKEQLSVFCTSDYVYRKDVLVDIVCTELINN
ncbi:serine hydrolase domain-containing protein [Butyrivibrio sp.]|uniref:serine hydrolase domain-containing protein n=1 Tax=Butyrivibrio sp. TaxID=28121 RepID=UPI0025C4B0D4|nr:serine hydrolase domain-containing protein [Butyrivibrio sp.]MBE5838449.1 beta-lactamase family protein [Butyrivibrio sp.]